MDYHLHRVFLLRRMHFVGLSNILDGELKRRKPVQRSHREVVGAAVVDSELLCEIVQGKESMGRIEAFQVLPVAAQVPVLAAQDPLAAAVGHGCSGVVEVQQVLPVGVGAAGEQAQEQKHS